MFLSQKNISFRIVDSQNPQFLLQNAKSGLGNQSLPNRFLNDGKLNHSVGCTKARINVHSIFLWKKELFLQVKNVPQMLQPLFMTEAGLTTKVVVG
ncbi:hypothetical protein LEP1GSC196_2327 [Leptospira meyeri serovar Semaranga str. Veldrot Semarang 173]|nr:hypothetical protein LEP1GSC196_2327 [Leptospira meyeri serovar Semaranga str. Veldrot Semarang 173]